MKTYEIKVEERKGFEVVKRSFISTDNYQEALSFLIKRKIEENGQKN